MVQDRLDLDVRLQTQQLQRDAREVLRTTRALDRAFSNINPRSTSLVERELRRSKTTADQLNTSIRRTTGELSGLGRTAQLTARRFIVYNIIAGFFFRIAGAVREGVSAFVAFDSELNKARQILNPLNTDFAQFVDSIFELGDAFGVSIAQIQAAQDTFIRQGRSQAETLELTRQALSLAAAAGIDYAEATEAITASINQFADQQIRAADVADRFTAVSIRNAVTATDLDQAIRRAGSAANTVGVEFNNLIGFITAAQEATRRGGTVIGTGLRTIFTRIFRAPSIEALQELGIETRKATGEFRNADSIIADLARRFEDLNQTQRISIASTIAGQRQVATFLAVLSNFEKAQKAASDAQNSNGEAARLVRIRQESLEAQLQKVTNEFLRFGAAIGEAISDDVIDFLNLFGDAFSAVGDLISGSEGLGISPLIGTLTKLGGVLALQTVGVGRIGQSFREAGKQAAEARNAVREFNESQGRAAGRFGRIRQLFTGTDPRALLEARNAQVSQQQAVLEQTISEQKNVQVQREQEIANQKSLTTRLAAEENNLTLTNNQILKDIQSLRKAEVDVVKERNRLDAQGAKITRSQDNLKILEAERKEIEGAVAAAQGRLSAIQGSTGAGRGADGTRGLQLERDRIVLAKELLRNQEKIDVINQRIERSTKAANAGRRSGVLTETQLARAVQARAALEGSNARVLRDLRANSSEEQIRAARQVGAAEIRQLRNSQAVAREKNKIADLDRQRQSVTNDVANAEGRVAQITNLIATRERDIAFIKAEIARIEQLRAGSAANNEQLAQRELALTQRLVGEEQKLADLEKRRAEAQVRGNNLIRGSTLRRGIGAFGISAIFQVATESLEVFGDTAEKETQRITSFVQDIGGALSTAFLIGGPLGIVLGGVQAIFAVVKSIRDTAFEWKTFTEGIQDLQSEINNSLRASESLFNNIATLSARIQTDGLSSANFQELNTRLSELRETFKGLNDDQLASFRERLTTAVENNDIEAFRTLRAEIERLNIIGGIQTGEIVDRENLERGLQTIFNLRSQIEDIQREINAVQARSSDDPFGNVFNEDTLADLREELQEVRSELTNSVAELQGQGQQLVQVFTRVIDPVRDLRQNLQGSLLESFIEQAGVLGTAAERFLEVRNSASIASSAIEELNNRSRNQVDATRELVEALREEQGGLDGIISTLAENAETQDKLTQSVFRFRGSIPEEELRTLSQQFRQLTQQRPEDVFRNLSNVLNEGNGRVRLLRDSTGELFIAIDGINGVVPQSSAAFEGLFNIIRNGGEFTDLAITGFNKLGEDIIGNARITEILARSYEALASRLDRTTESLTETRRALSAVAAANSQVAQSFPTRALQSNRQVLESLVNSALQIDDAVLGSIRAFEGLERIAEDTSITFGARLQDSLSSGGRAVDLVTAQLDVARANLIRFREEGEKATEFFNGMSLGGGEGFRSVRDGAVGLVQELIAVQELGSAVLGLDALKQQLLTSTGEVLAEDIDLIIQFRETLARGFNLGPTEFGEEELIDPRALGRQIGDLLDQLGSNIIRDSENPFAAAGQRLAAALIEGTNRTISTGGDAITRRLDTILTELSIAVSERLREPIQQLRQSLEAVRRESDQSLSAVVENAGMSLDSLNTIIQRGIIPPQSTLTDILVGDFNVAIVAAEELVNRATAEVSRFNAELAPTIRERDSLLEIGERTVEQEARLAELKQLVNDRSEESAELEARKRQALAEQNALLGRFNQILNTGLGQLGQNFQEVIRAQAAVAEQETRLFQLRLGFIDEETALFTERTAQLALERQQIEEIRRGVAGLGGEIDVQSVGQQIEQLTAQAAQTGFQDAAQSQAIRNRISDLNNQLSIEKTISENRLESLQKELDLINEQSEAINDFGVDFLKATDQQQQQLVRAARLTENFFGGITAQGLNTNQITGAIENFIRTANDDTRALVIGQLERLEAVGGEIAPGVGAADILRQIGEAVGGAILRNPEIELAERQRQLQEQIVNEQRRLIEIATVQLRVDNAQLQATQALVNTLGAQAVANGATGGGTLGDIQRNGVISQRASQAVDALLDREQQRTRQLQEEEAQAGRAAASNQRFVDTFRNVELTSSDTTLTLDEFRSQMVELRDALVTAEDAVIDAQQGVTDAFSQISDALINAASAQADYTLGIREAQRENTNAIGGFTTFRDELSFLNSAFQEQISALREVGATETQVAELRARLAREQLGIFEDQIRSIEANAQRLLTSQDGSQFFNASRAGELVGQLIRDVGVGPGTGADANQQRQISEAVLSLPLELRQSLNDAFSSAPPGSTFAGFSPQELEQLVLSSLGGQNAATPDLLSLQQQAAEQRNIIAENQLQQLEQARAGVNAAFEGLRTAQEELLAAQAQRDLAQLQLDALQFELPRQTNLLEEVASNLRSINGVVRANVSSLAGSPGAFVTNAAGGTLTPSEVGGLVRAASREKRAMPNGAQLGVFNTSETVLTRKQARMLRKTSRIPNAVDGFGNVSSDNQAIINGLQDISNKLDRVVRDDGTRNINLNLDSSRRVRVDGVAGLNTALQDIFSERSAEMFSREEGESIRRFIEGLVQRLRVNGLNLPPDVERNL